MRAQPRRIRRASRGTARAKLGPTLVAALLLATGGAAHAKEGAPESPAVALQTGWDAFIAGLERGRDALDTPAAMPPPPTERNLAEGYRYLLGHLARIIESEIQGDPAFPYFQRSVRLLSKWTIDNTDTLYLKAIIEGDGTYEIRGRAADTTEWRTGERGVAGPKAPRIAIFQTITALIGQTGGLAEMAACRNQTLDYINSFDLEMAPDGSFSILVAPERPEDYTGNFLPTRKEMPCTDRQGNTTTRLREATAISVREIFSDWDNEESLDLSIRRLDKPSARRPAATAEAIAVDLARIGELVDHQVRFWNQLHEIGLEVSGDRNGDGRTNHPINGINPPRPPFIAGGVAGARQLYSGGTFELDDDEALVVKIDLRRTDPHYVGFHLGNLWGESADQATYASSLSGGQLATEADGARYYVISKRDPGFANWIDTTGLAKGTMTLRLIYRDDVPLADLPSAEAQLVPVSEVASALPPGARRVSAAERADQVARRAAHIQRRWRQY